MVPAFILAEGTYLVRHQKKFSWFAVFAWAVITGSSIFFISNKPTLPLVPVIDMVAIVVYYLLRP